MGITSREKSKMNNSAFDFSVQCKCKTWKKCRLYTYIRKKIREFGENFLTFKEKLYHSHLIYVGSDWVTLRTFDRFFAHLDHCASTDSDINVRNIWFLSEKRSLVIMLLVNLLTVEHIFCIFIQTVRAKMELKDSIICSGI